MTTLTANGLEQALASGGGTSAGQISACVRRVSNQAEDNLSFTLQISADAPDPFPYGTKIILRINRSQSPFTGAFSGGTIFFIGWRIDASRSASGLSESVNYKFAGPWEFFLERLVFQKLFLYWNGTKQVADYRSQIVLGLSLTILTGPSDTVSGSTATQLMSISQQVREIVNYCIAQTTAQYGSAQFQFDPLNQNGDGTWQLSASPGPNCLIPDYVPGYRPINNLATGQTSIALRAPLEAVQDITCAEALRHQLRWIGGVGSPVLWFDYTATDGSGHPLPALKISTRDQLPAVGLPAWSSQIPIPASGSKSLQIARRDDLVPSCVDLKYRVKTFYSGLAFTQIIDDIACAAGGTDSSSGATDPSLLPNGRGFGVQIATIDFEGASFVSINSIPLQLDGSVDSYACYRKIFPELAGVTNLSGGYTTITDPETGATVDPSPYSYILRDPGLNGAVGGIARRVVVRAIFGYTEVGGKGQADYHEFNAHLTLTNLAPGAYISGFGEAIPFGLASYIYNIEKIPQYQGSYTLQETEVTDACPMGNNLNLTGALAEWTSMNACVQQITYDLDAATTELTFGPAAHLGAQDLVERLRLNRPARLFYLVGANLLNTW